MKVNKKIGFILFALISFGLYSNKAVAAVAGSEQLTITKENFTDYFSVNGDATYEPSTGILTLTPNDNDKSGNSLLKNKIDISKSFTLKGKINLGDKSQINGGADGIGFIFHNGNTTDVGLKGGSVGMGGLIDAFGFKLDTYYNKSDDTTRYKFYHDPSLFGNAQGRGTPFGAFYKTDDAGIVSTYSDSDAPAKQIAEPENNQFKDITIDYDGETEIMTITYDGQSWSKDLSTWTTGTSYSFGLTASTGGQKNLQQFQIDEFDYYAYGVIKTKYVDKATGEEIITGKEFSGDIDDTQTNLKELDAQVLALGYTYDSVSASADSNYNRAADSATFTKEDQTITYYYTKNSESSSSESSSESTTISVPIENTTEPTSTSDETTEPTSTSDETTEPTSTSDETTEPTSTSDETTEPTSTSDETTEPTSTSDETTEPSSSSSSSTPVDQNNNSDSSSSESNSSSSTSAPVAGSTSTPTDSETTTQTSTSSSTTAPITKKISNKKPTTKKKTKAVQTTATETLPQTSETKNPFLGLAGIFLLIVASSVVLYIKKEAK